MEDVTSAVTHQPVVMIIDQNKLRRVSVMNFLRPWADGISASLLGLGLFDLTAELETDDCRLIVLNLGGSSIASPDSRECLEVLSCHASDIPVVLFSDLEDPVEVVTAFQLGMKGFVPASVEPDIVVHALTFIMGGGTFYPPKVLLELRSDRAAGSVVLDIGQIGDLSFAPRSQVAAADLPGGRGKQLTLRQLDVLALLREGKSNKMIARDLGMCEATVKVHVRQIMRKLGASNRTQAALCALPGPSEIFSCADPGEGVEEEVSATGAAGPEKTVCKIAKVLELGRQAFVAVLVAVSLVQGTSSRLLDGAATLVLL